MTLSSMNSINRLDNWLMQIQPPENTRGWRRFCWEFWFFGLKQARACLFVALFFTAVLLVPSAGLLSIPRYDVLLILALLIQAWMLWRKPETLDELKAICLFHLVGFALEVFKTSGSIQSWSYPGFAYSKVFGVPLYAGFMYAAVGSYIIQSWRLMQQRVVHHPPYWMAVLVALLIYANFFSHHYIGDFRWYIAAATLGLYARTTVYFTPLDRERKMPLLLGFILVGFFIWLAENISTLLGLWSYPNQLGAWSVVHIGKWSSWSLLVIMTFTIVAQLKYVKARIDIPQ